MQTKRNEHLNSKTIVNSQKKSPLIKRPVNLKQKITNK